MEFPLISVLLVNYNHEQYLSQCIDSVLNQTYQNIQFIIVDDGSTDNSNEIISNYCKIDDRIDYFPSPINKHISHATNLGFTKVKGDYLARIDSDDIWYLNKLETQLQFFNSNTDCNICFSWVDLIDENNNIINENQKDLFLLYSTHTQSQEDWLRFFFFYGNCLCHTSVMMKSKVLRETGEFNLSFRQIHDFDFWVRIAKKNQLFIIEKRLLAVRRFIGSDMINNSSYNKIDMTRYFNEFMILKYHFFDDIDTDVFIRTFRPSFRNKSASTPEELECEKAFLLFHAYQNGRQLPFLGMLKIEELYRDKKYVSILENSYSFTPKKFYEISCNPVFYDIKVLESEINDLNTNIMHLESELKNHKETIDTLTNSTCWKLTKPIRFFLDKYKSSPGSQ